MIMVNAPVCWLTEYRSSVVAPAEYSSVPSALKTRLLVALAAFNGCGLPATAAGTPVLASSVKLYNPMFVLTNRKRPSGDDCPQRGRE